MRHKAHRFAGALMLTLPASLVRAEEALSFKQPFSPKISWINYALVIVVLLITALAIARKIKPSSTSQSSCQLLEKKYLGNKTVVYVIDYQEQRFLLADNQHALAIYPLLPGNVHEQK